MKNDFAKIREEIDAMQPELVRIRRDLHRFPETGWLEMRTTAILAKALRAMGYETYTGRAVCKEGARLGLPDEAALAAHAERALAQGAPEDELTADVRAGYKGVIAILRCGEGPTVAMRFDIDALPMARVSQASWARRRSRASLSYTAGVGGVVVDAEDQIDQLASSDYIDTR